MKYLLFTLIMMSISIIMLNHPMSLGMILLSQTILISLILNTLNYNFWFSYIIFLIMIGGMLILFIYMTSIASNEKFKLSNKLIMLMSIYLSTMILIFMIDNFYMNTQLFNYETMMTNYHYNYKFSMNKMFNYPNFYIYYMSIIYLLITLIAVVKIANMNFGPLRQKN